MSDYTLHPEAYSDLDQIWEFIATDSTDTADRTIEEMFGKFRKLVNHPFIGHRRSDLTRRPLRFWRIRDYLIAYAPEETRLWVIAVVHGRRDPRTLAAILQSREIPN